MLCQFASNITVVAATITMMNLILINEKENKQYGKIGNTYLLHSRSYYRYAYLFLSLIFRRLLSRNPK